jgi:sugar lactone lactonase YvrE
VFVGPDRLGTPFDLALGRDDELHFSTTGRTYVVSITDDERLQVVAGNGEFIPNAAQGPGPDVSLAFPGGISISDDGTIYIADDQRVWKVDREGIATVIAGSIGAGDLGDGGPATEAALDSAIAVAPGPDGRIYIADAGHHRVRAVAEDGTISTLAGRGESGTSGDGGPATEAALDFPSDLAFDAAGDLFIADIVGDVIRKVDASGQITTVAGDPRGGSTRDGIRATRARLDAPSSIAFDEEGTLYVAAKHHVHAIDDEGIMRTIAGSTAGGASGDGIPALDARLRLGAGMAVAADGDIYIRTRSGIRRIDGEGVITTVWAPPE